MRSSRGNKSRVWPMSFKARWRERSQVSAQPDHCLRGSLRPASTPPSCLPHFSLPTRLGGPTTGAWRRGLCCSPSPGQGIGGLLELQAEQMRPLQGGETNFLQHPGLTKPQQQQEQGCGWRPPHDLKLG